MPAATLPPALPAPAAAPVPAETRLAYVLRHFRQVYADVPAVAIGYADAQPAVIVRDGAGDFFRRTDPYPPAPNQREWAGQPVPFFFDPRPAAPLLELTEGRAVIHADVIAAAFYLLSGWQEYFSDARDRHGRFPYAASVQKQYGFVALPVVNYYFDVLKTAVEHVTGRPLRLRRWAGTAPFAAFISHDIDNLRSAWKTPAKAALRQGKLLQFGQLLGRHLARPDAWDNLEAVAAAVVGYGARSTFFVLPEPRPGADGTPNADYDLSRPVCQRLGKLHEQGHEVAFHGSIGTATDARQFEREREHLQRRLRGVPYTAGLRFHYLRWDPRRTLGALERASAAYDSTLGFAEHYGFRHSYCHPFYPFDFARGEASSLLEIPLNVMDATLHHPRYLQLRPEEIIPALRPMLVEIERFGGVATILWHNENFDPSNTTNGPREFGKLLTVLRWRGAAFLTGREIWQQFPA